MKYRSREKWGEYKKRGKWGESKKVEVGTARTGTLATQAMYRLLYVREWKSQRSEREARSGGVGV